MSYAFFRASAYDLSTSGLGLIMHQFEVGEFCSLGPGTLFTFILPSPGGSIELEAEPVRYHLLDEGDGGLVLVGVNITRMDDANREKYAELVRQSHEGDR